MTTNKHLVLIKNCKIKNHKDYYILENTLNIVKMLIKIY